jgi:hypothetical protein
VAQIAALVLLVFGLLPIANWIPGGHDAPWYSQRLADWLSGGSIVLGIGVIAAIAFNRYPGWWRTGLWSGVAGRWRRGNRRSDALIAVVVFVVCAVIAQLVLSAKPLLIDEIIQLYQARIFATGHLWLPAATYPVFSSAMHLIDWSGKVYGQFPAGGPAMLVPGVWLHAPWLVGPAFTAIGAYLLARVLRRMELGDGTALAALLLYAFAPFTLFLGGSMMNHVTETTWLLAATLALLIAVADDNPHDLAGFICGLCLGVAATIRPTDAAAFALPTAGWLLWRARHGGPALRALLLSGVGVALPMAVLLYINSQQTGSALRFGYIEMWGSSHELGFHKAPWGVAHTPARGLELVNLYFLRLQDYMFESAGPSLLFASAALALTRRLRAFDRWILLSCAMLVLAYFAYWHDGFYLGPRFMLPLAPWIALWTARLPALLRERNVPLPVLRGTVTAGVAALLIGCAMGVPVRTLQYHNGMQSMRLDADATAAAAGATNALILVRESWGAQLVSRLWGLGVSRTETEHLYRSYDACRLDNIIAATEADQGGVDELHRRLAPFAGDSVQLRTDKSLPDTTIRFVPNAPHTELCLRRVAEDRGGFASYPQMLLAGQHGNRFERDLHERDTLLLRMYPGRPLWLLTESPRIGGGFQVEKVSVDSMHAEWQQDRAPRP